MVLLAFLEVTWLSAYPKTVGDWPGTIAAMVVRSLRSKMCLSPFLKTVGDWLILRSLRSKMCLSPFLDRL
jgi:hypothetical protein